METPVCDFVENYRKKNAIRLHMPGHKGENISGVEEFDITEISGADVLYHDEGIIRKSRENAASLFGSGKILYSAEGSSLSIRAMLAISMVYAGKKGIKPIILAGRNAHKSFVTGAAVLDIDVKWLYSEEKRGIISLRITPELLEKRIEALENEDEKPAAVYITSPDYLGNISDIKGISEVCRKKDILLLVDNAHGAYLKFLPESLHPVSLGADICCDSAHKTLPVLTGGGYLHISKNAPAEIFDMAENAMTLFASTSPSYLILQSLDRTNKFLAEEYPKKLSQFSKKVSNLKAKLQNMGFILEGNEPLKITVNAKAYGYEGTELAQILEENNIFPEFSDPDYLVMMFSVNNTDEAFEKTEKVFEGIKMKKAIENTLPELSEPLKKMSLKDAVMTPGKWLPVGECLGKTLLSPSVTCPPAISVVVCGEVIDEKAIELFKYYKIEKCYVCD